MTPPIPKLAGATPNATLFHQTFATLSSKTKEGLAARTSSWSQADPNGNSYVSLAEIDAFVLERLKVDHGTDVGAALHKEYRPAYLLAFNRSKSLAPTQQATASSTSDDYLTKREFRLFFVNLVFHVLALDCFAIVDGGGAGVDAGDDRRISPQELEDAATTTSASSPAISAYGFAGLKDAKDGAGAAKVFQKMDANGGGIVLLDEFCAYLIAREMAAKTDMGKELDVDLSAAKSPTPAKKTKSSGGTTPKKPSSRQPPSATKSSTTTPGGKTRTKKKPTVADPAAPQFRKPGPSADLKLFQSALEPLIDLKDPHAKKDRAAAWKNADPNGNGMLSLAEVDSWVQTALVATHRPFKGKQLYKLYRPSYILAFDAAKSLADGGNDDYVTKKEFRLLLAYLNLHADLFDAFAAIDGGGPGVDANDDRRISRDEWMKGHHSVSTYDWAKLHKLTDAEAATVFDAMDADGGGMVLLNEWCDYLIRAEVRAGTATGQLLRKIPKYSSLEDEVAAPAKDDGAAEKARMKEEKRAAAKAKAASEAELEKERIAAAKAAKAQQLEEERIAAEKAAAESKRLEKERIAKEKAAAKKRIAAEKASKADKLEQERLEQERIAAEKASKAEADRLEQERIASEKAEADRLEQERLEQERIAAEKASKAEADRLEQERIASEKAEADRLEQERLEQERIAAEKASKAEADKLEQERLEQERIAAEKVEAQRVEQERIAAEEAELKALEEEEARLAAEEAELKKLEEKEGAAPSTAEDQAAKEAEILRQKELEAQRLNEEIQKESEAPAEPTETTDAPVSSLTSSFKKAAPFASSLRAAAGSSLAAAAAKASSLAKEVKKDMEGE